MNKFILIALFLISQAFAAEYKIMAFDEPIKGYKKVCSISGYKIYQYGEKVQSSVLAVPLEIKVQLNPHATDTQVEIHQIGASCSKIVIQGPNQEQKIYSVSKPSGNMFKASKLPQ